MANVLIEESTLTAIGEAIRAKTGKTDLILPSDMATEIAEITGGGGSSDLVKYVTFMDGATELFKMPVLAGDDCKDPVSHGDIDTPTKESTNTINYAHSGWSLTNGGSADSSALKNVTEDRIVYASFAESVRYYTVRFYDDDSITLLKTVETTYNSDVSSYVPIKEGYIFKGWSVDVTNVTSDISTFAIWEVDQGWISYLGTPETAEIYYPRFPTSPYGNVNNIAYTHDGSKLFALSDSKVSVYDTTTVPYTRLTELGIGNFNNGLYGVNITVSPDDKYLFVSRSHTLTTSPCIKASVLVYQITDTGATQITDSSTIFKSSKMSTKTVVADVVFSPDKTKVYVIGSSRSVSSYKIGQYPYIEVYDVGTSNYTLNTTATDAFNAKVVAGELHRMKFSSDGTKIFQISKGGIVVYDVKNNYEVVTGNYFASSTFNGYDVEVSPDGRYVAFVGNGGFAVYDTETLDINGKYTLVSSGTSSTYGPCYGLAFSKKGVLTIGHEKAPYMSSFAVGTWAKKDAPDIIPTYCVLGCVYTDDGSELALHCYPSSLTTDTDIFMMAYKVNL
jgi:hypothetical protein